MELIDVVALMGLVFGLIGTVLGICNFLRDRASVQVSLQWNIVTLAEGVGDSDLDKRGGIVRVTNIGRRSIFVSHAAIRLPKHLNAPLFLLKDGIEGKTLAEGSPSLRYFISDVSLREYADYQPEMIAEVTDSTGKVWSSKRSWAARARANISRLL